VSAADALVESLAPITLVVGKGGVGKTTAACALARASAGRGVETLLVTTDPARALPLVLDVAVGTTASDVPGTPHLHAQLLDAAQLRPRFLERWGDALRTILDRGTYLDESDINPLVDTALPGSDEIFAALALAELFGQRQYARIVVDTAPTGHTLRLLRLPQTFRALVQLLEAMQSKHRFMVRALTRAYKSDAADAMLSEMSGLVTALDDALHDASRAGAVLVANDQDVVVAESVRFLRDLNELRVNVTAWIWNGEQSPGDADIGDIPQYTTPRLPRFPVGASGLDAWLAALRRAPTKRKRPRSPAKVASARKVAGSPALAKILRPLTIVAGKGGVGKTTVASALALHAATTRRTLVVSTDPAPSLADVFAIPIGDADTPVRDTANLFARQMDASAAFERLRADYAARVDALFDGLVARGVDLSHDHAITRELLALAPPGVDEVYALSLIADALFADRYATVIVDPAPTGHLLRLLEMPALALDWAHQLLRLMLKYKEVAGLGETAREVLEFSRSLRALDALIRDPERCAVVIVSLDEPVVRAETERLATEVRARGAAVTAVVLNRAPTAADVTSLPVPDAPVHFVAPAIAPPPTGTRALLAWSTTWDTR
jgi:arsenite/tail-anchored protein-transporting ATPase